MRPVCVSCKQEMRCSKTGAMVTHDNRIWSGDAFMCSSCNVEIVLNFGRPFFNDHHEFRDQDLVVALETGEDEDVS